jgi:hypothetical protein
MSYGYGGGAWILFLILILLVFGMVPFFGYSGGK